MKKTKEAASYEKKQLDSGFRVGDLVFVTRKAKNYENGWQAAWVSPMDNSVGQVGRITEICMLGISVCFDNRYTAFYPYFVLKKDKSLNNKHSLQLDI